MTLILKVVDHIKGLLSDIYTNSIVEEDEEEEEQEEVVEDKGMETEMEEQVRSLLSLCRSSVSRSVGWSVCHNFQKGNHFDASIGKLIIFIRYYILVCDLFLLGW